MIVYLKNRRKCLVRNKAQSNLFNLRDKEMLKSESGMYSNVIYEVLANIGFLDLRVWEVKGASLNDKNSQ